MGTKNWLGGGIKIAKEIIGYTMGTFDLFHIGHLNILRNAKALCSKLIVGVSTDELMIKRKKKKPTIPFRERIEIIRSIKFVDATIPQRQMNKYEQWKKLHFDILFVGDDWYNTPSWKTYEKKLKAKGVRVVYLPYTKGISSTIINKKLVENDN